jgi:hypothetical protein
VTKQRAATWLCIVFAFVVWNVVFDRVIVQAGRDYVDLAMAAARSNAPYVKIEDTMRPARSRALWLATASATAILVVFISVRRLQRT